MIDIMLISIPAFWVVFTCCLAWCLTSSKKHAIITFDDATRYDTSIRNAPTAPVTNGDLYHARTEKSPTSNATADTNTRKNDRYSTASLKPATSTTEIKQRFLLHPTKSASFA